MPRIVAHAVQVVVLRFPEGLLVRVRLVVLTHLELEFTYGTATVALVAALHLDPARVPFDGGVAVIVDRALATCLGVTLFSTWPIEVIHVVVGDAVVQVIVGVEALAPRRP